ncbi:V-type ATP synthase subunit D [Neptunomonas concharum]|uniref:V-type ATP synthase subunit D n=1 Tax=Neptunomonas concharum TaxID=1031538 RepID=A0A5P1R8K6_9GAMM|nr:V-type ATP synthase subunit D [Neptunomonas concharum]QEQ95626.1 V-type ATP synthase subunit D [Neptunomonas concharum]
MAKLALNKSTLNKESRRLKSYRQVVPALDLKRKQLMAARVETQKLLLAHQAELAQLREKVEGELTLLASHEIDLSTLLKVTKLTLVSQNLVGLKLPLLDELVVERQAYSRLVTPFWVDLLVSCLEEALQLEVRISIENKRLDLLGKGLQKTTQRLNLFEKVLIPQSEKNLRKIRIALSDAERAGVVRAKIAKNKRRSLVTL